VVPTLVLSVEWWWRQVIDWTEGEAAGSALEAGVGRAFAGEVATFFPPDTHATAAQASIRSREVGSLRW
jgi:hypothetical protein